MCLDPVSIGYNPSNIIPNGNVININISPLEPRRRREISESLILEPVSGPQLICYATRGHENPIWEVPTNSSLNPQVFVLSPYESALSFNDSVPYSTVESFVCRSSNNTDIYSSVILTNSKSTFIILQ